MTTHEYASAYRAPSDAIRAALLTARLAAQHREQAAEQYRAAVVAAHRAGCGYAELASVLRVSRQAIRQLIITN